VTHQPDNSHEVPVKIYRSDERLTVAALMPGVLAADVRVERRGLRVGGSGRPDEVRSTAEFLDARQRLVAEHSFTTR